MSLQAFAIEVCPACGNPLDRFEGYTGYLCTPLRCSAWETIGISRNGGPLLIDMNKLDGKVGSTRG